MSIYSFQLSFLQTSPKVWENENQLFARTSLLYRVLNLFFYSRTVVVDRIKKHIEIKIKTFWFFTSRKYIPLDDIKCIDIEKRKKGGFGFTPEQDIVDKLYVQVIRKKNQSPVKLFRFVGDGGEYDRWGGSLLFDVEGMHYEKALNYAKLVTKYTGSQLGEEHKIEYNTKIDHYKCLKCGHEITSKIKCIYCGSPEIEKRELTS